MYVYGSIVEPSGFRVLGIVVALGVPFNKQQLLSISTDDATQNATSMGAVGMKQWPGARRTPRARSKAMDEEALRSLGAIEPQELLAVSWPVHG